jgi:hypothetical protein
MIASARRRAGFAAWALKASVAAAVIGLECTACLAPSVPEVREPPHIPAAVPASPPIRVCGNNTILGGGPSSAPPGSVTVPPGSNSGVNWARANTTYWFAPGIHTLAPGEYDQIIPGPGSRYIGAPGAVLDGQHANATAFGGNVTKVTVEYLTIQDFSTPGSQGAVNASAAAGWTIEYNTIQKVVPGTAIYAGTNNVIEHNCLTENGQSGFGTYTVHDTSPLTHGASNIVINDNEITRNGTCNWEALPKWPGPTPPPGCQGVPTVPGCGCSGGGKFWQADGGRFEDNFVHDNYGVGVWWDSNNTGFDIEGNYISDNYSSGLIYEISYNALIRHNTFIRNGLVAGPLNPGFPTAALYISESGSDARVQGKYKSAFLITGNVFRDNWSGVVLWENSNRFCNSPANTTSGVCTLVDPRVANITSCASSHISRPPYYNDCRWKTENILVEHNTFEFLPAHIGPRCTPANRCGFQGLFSEYGTYPSWSPYQGTVVEDHVTFHQGNHFTSNTYIGPWLFLPHDQGNVVSWAEWRGKLYNQDAGSTFRPELASQGN